MQMCQQCDAPDVLAEALDRGNELGLLLSHNRIHEVLMAWGAMLELHKIEQVMSPLHLIKLIIAIIPFNLLT